MRIPCLSRSLSLICNPVVGVGSYPVSLTLIPFDSLLGITTDLLVYSIIIPVMPFQLERLGYHSVSALTGWLLSTYVSRPSSPQHSLTDIKIVIRGGHLCVPHVLFSLPHSHHPSATMPIAVFSEKTSSRRTPLLIGLLCLLAAQILLMESPNYALMVVARFLQGVSSSVVSTVGLALM